MRPGSRDVPVRVKISGTELRQLKKLIGDIQETARSSPRAVGEGVRGLRGAAIVSTAGSGVEAGT